MRQPRERVHFQRCHLVIRQVQRLQILGKFPALRVGVVHPVVADRERGQRAEAVEPTLAHAADLVVVQHQLVEILQAPEGAVLEVGDAVLI